MLTFHASNGTLYVRDGGRDAILTQDQADQLLGIWHEAGAHHLFNDLHEAAKEAGMIPWGRPALRLVSDHGPSHTRAMLEASLRALNSEPPTAA